MQLPPFVKEVVLPITLMVLGVAFGFFLDWLNHSYPHLFDGTSARRPDARRSGEPGASVHGTERDADHAGTSSSDPPTARPACRRSHAPSSDMTLLVEDAYGSLYRCPACRGLYYWDSVYAKLNPVSEEWAESVMQDRSDPSR